jgi:hypothetical protein
VAAQHAALSPPSLFPVGGGGSVEWRKDDKTDDETVERIAEQKLVHHLEQESLEFNDYAIADDRVIVRKTARSPRE